MDSLQSLSERFERRRRRARRVLAAFMLAGILPFTLMVSQAQTSRTSDSSAWVATWGAAMMATRAGHAPDFTGQTLRQIVHVDRRWEASEGLVFESLRDGTPADWLRTHCVAERCRRH